MADEKKQLDVETIVILATAAEKLIMDVYTLIQNAGRAPDDAASYVARIQAAAAAVPAPKVG
jgi:hypothetical protein